MTAYLLVLRWTIVKVGHQIVQCTGLHRCIAEELQAPTLLIQHTEPTHISMIARLLRTDVRIVFICHLIIIETDKLAAVAIDVVFSRTTAIILNCIKLRWHLQLHTIAEHLTDLGFLIGLQLLAHDYLTIRCQRVGHLKFCLHVRHFKLCFYQIVIHINILEFHLRILPHTESLL